MNVTQLINILAKYPPSMPVEIYVPSRIADNAAVRAGNFYPISSFSEFVEEPGSDVLLLNALVQG